MSLRSNVVAVPFVVRIVVACAILLGLAPHSAGAHPLGNFTTNHLTRLTLTKGVVVLHYVLDMAEIPTVALEHTISASGQPTAAQYAAWGQAHAREIAPQLAVDADGSPLALDSVRTSVATRPGAAGLRTVYFQADYRAPLPPRTRGIVYHDRTEPGRLGWRDVVLAPATEPTRELRVYPSALVGSPRARLSLAATFDARGVARQAPDASDDVPLAGAPSVGRMDALSDILAHDGAGPAFIFGALVLAIGLGALHALEPGHGKTLLAVSLVGARATAAQALILAGSLTFAHTVGVIVLGAIVLFATRWIVPESIYPWVSLGSGLLVAGLGARALAASGGPRARPRAPARAPPYARSRAWAWSRRPRARAGARGAGLGSADLPHRRPGGGERQPRTVSRGAGGFAGRDRAASGRVGNDAHRGI